MAVLVAGFILGGTVGVGTVLYAVAIGPLLQMFLPYCEVRLEAVAMTPTGPSLDP